MANAANKGREKVEGKPGPVPEVVSLKDAAEALSEMSRVIRLRHYSYSTERSYLQWGDRFLAYAAKTGGKKIGDITTEDMRDFLTHLALEQRVSASTQNQAFNALLFLFRNVLHKDVSGLNTAVRAKRGPKLPVVLTVGEVKRLLEHLTGTSRLIAELLYGSGLRLMELARLRVQDVDFEANTIFVRSGKGDKDRSTLLPAGAKEKVRAHLLKVKALHEKDLAAGFGAVHLPDALDRKYPNAANEWKWQYVFPAATLSVDPRSGVVRRHHLSDTAIQTAVKKAVQQGGHREACHRPHAQAQLCHAPAAERRQHPRGAGAPRPQERGNHDDLHPCPQDHVEGAGKPAGHAAQAGGGASRRHEGNHTETRGHRPQSRVPARPGDHGGGPAQRLHHRQGGDGQIDPAPVFSGKQRPKGSSSSRPRGLPPSTWAGRRSTPSSGSSPT